MIARRLITLHGGTIDVASDGSGTLCTIDLPLLEQPWEESSPEPPAERRRLLLVEDNDDTARSLKAALEHLGYEVAVAHDAPIALNLARSFQPDVALLDLGLPVMDGWELARRLHEATAQLPIVAVTARDQEADKRRSAELGFVDHLVKPIDLPRLQKIVERVSASREES
jgi:CheY-like chemotaxis protein